MGRQAVVPSLKATFHTTWKKAHAPILTQAKAFDVPCVHFSHLPVLTKLFREDTRKRMSEMALVRRHNRSHVVNGWSADTQKRMSSMAGQIRKSACQKWSPNVASGGCAWL
eukprot:1160088-Pelagomonas_calceolata.AAC.7